MSVRVGVLTDVHAVQDTSRRAEWHNAYDFAGVEGRLARAMELFAAERTQVVVLLGDLAHDGDAPSLRAALGPASAGPPVLAVGGNHDGEHPTAGLGAVAPASVRLVGWRAVAPFPGAGTPVRVAGVRVVHRARDRWVGARPPALRTWGSSPVVLASHFPLLSRAGAVRERGLPYAGDLADRAQLAAAVCRRRAPTVVLCGHLHVRDSAASGALLQLACAALVEPPFEATVVDVAVSDGSVRLERRAHELGPAPQRRDPRLAPAHECWAFSPGRVWRRV